MREDKGIGGENYICFGDVENAYQQSPPTSVVSQQINEPSWSAGEVSRS